MKIKSPQESEFLDEIIANLRLTNQDLRGVIETSDRIIAAALREERRFVGLDTVSTLQV